MSVNACWSETARIFAGVILLCSHAHSLSLLRSDSFCSQYAVALIPTTNTSLDHCYAVTLLQQPPPLSMSLSPRDCLFVSLFFAKRMPVARSVTKHFAAFGCTLHPRMCLVSSALCVLLSARGRASLVYFALRLCTLVLFCFDLSSRTASSRHC